MAVWSLGYMVRQGLAFLGCLLNPTDIHRVVGCNLGPSASSSTSDPDSFLLPRGPEPLHPCIRSDMIHRPRLGSNRGYPQYRPGLRQPCVAQGRGCRCAQSHLSGCRCRWWWAGWSWYRH
ncbi:hypothetical protein BKA70DRAFT_823635 [Coprinopsis sp. MPI-PUGE-AT-0042]|nr:hypothetical protein BKA70DRAFT_823635 [Coprinopsis sp. MPI-PUGE-AT-0042]